jgi:hypothetical protein
MIKYVGNCSDIIDWDRVIEKLKDATPDYIGPKHTPSDDIPGLDEISKLWKRAGYKNKADGGTVAWDMFFPGKQFDQLIVDQFAKFVGVETYKACWISRINVGYFAPQHWDVTDDETELALLPEFPRYHCHIGKPKFGHIFIAGEQCFYNQEQGATYRWPSRKLWHAGNNIGLEPKYILNFW